MIIIGWKLVLELAVEVAVGVGLEGLIKAAG